MKCPKLYRVYFNRIEDAPQIWSVDEGSIRSEINVQEVEVRAPMAVSRKNLEADYPEPKAWMEVFGELSIVAGCAVLT